MSNKKTHAQVDYTPKASNPKERCGLCAHYAGNHICNLVEGIVNENGWCKLFKVGTRADGKYMKLADAATALAARFDNIASRK